MTCEIRFPSELFVENLFCTK